MLTSQNEMLVRENLGYFSYYFDRQYAAMYLLDCQHTDFGVPAARWCQLLREVWMKRLIGCTSEKKALLILIDAFKYNRIHEFFQFHNNF